MTLDNVFDVIATQRLVVLSCVTALGRSQAALIGIGLHRSREIVFDTLQPSRKVVNLRARPAAALVIGWQGETTVQIEGIARESWAEELDSVKASYFAAWPDGKVRAHLTATTYFLITPRWVRYSDYLAGPLVMEFDISAPLAPKGPAASARCSRPLADPPSGRYTHPQNGPPSREI